MSNPTQATNRSSSPPNATSSLPSSKVSTQLRETIKLVQRFADKMVSKISNINNLDQELAERSKEMANVVSHLEACLALSSPPAKPYTLEVRNNEWCGHSSVLMHSFLLMTAGDRRSESTHQQQQQQGTQLLIRLRG